MFSFKKFSIKKGTILVNTLLLGTLCLVISLYLFVMELEKYKNIKSIKTSELKININQENEEYLFTDLSSYITDKINAKAVALTTSNIKELLSTDNTTLKIWHNGSYIIYNKGNDYFTICSYFDEYYHKEDIYDYTVKNNSFKCIYRNTTYVLGNIKQ